MVIFGLNPTREALVAASVSRVWVADRGDRRVRGLVEIATAAGVTVSTVDRAELDRLARGGEHQGIVASVRQAMTYGVEALVAGSVGPPLILVLDGVEDPHNFGAVVRTAEGAGAAGVVYRTRRAAPTSGAAMRASAGALAHVRLAPVVNIARAIGALKAAGVWVVGLAGDADRRYHDVDYTSPTAFVVGAEGAGLRRLVRARCDWLVSIPMRGRVSSLNVSVATGIVLYEAVRQRRQSEQGGPSTRGSRRGPGPR